MTPQLKTLRQTLLDRDAAFLEVIAGRWGLVVEGRGKGDLLDQLEAAMLQSDVVGSTLSDLTPPERDALDALLQAGGQMPVERFARQHGPIRHVGPGRLRREETWRQPAGGAEALWYRGMIGLGFDMDAVETEIVFIPPDFLVLLPRPEPAETPFTVASVAPAGPPRLGGTTLRQDVCSLLIYLYSVDVRAGPRNILPVRHQRQLVSALLDVDPDRLALIEHLAQAQGLIGQHDRRWQINPSRARAWLRSPSGEQLRSLQESWRDSPDWNDLFRVPSLECQSAGWSNDPQATRRRFLGWLARCPADRWLSIDGFVQALKAADPDFQRPDGDYDGWYIRDVDSSEYLTGFSSWDHVEGALARDLLTRPLFWLGIVALGPDGQGSGAFQLTDQGQAFLSGDPPPASRPATPLVMAADLFIQMPLDGNLYDRFQVARFADRVPASTEQSSAAYLYRVTPQSLARTREREIAVSQIVAFLERATAGNLPREVPTRLADWEGKADKVALRRAVLLQTADETTMEELRWLPQTQRYLQEIVGPRTALVAEDELRRLLQELRQLGYLPTMEGLARGHSTPSKQR